MQRAVKLTTQSSQIVYGQDVWCKNEITKSLWHQIRLSPTSKDNILNTLAIIMMYIALVLVQFSISHAHLKYSVS